MIISVSRRTDIPAFYNEWFYNRIKEGYVDVVNPFNAKQANRVSLKKEDVECFVFWTKNPKDFMKRLDELDGYNYYFQYTLNSYGKDIECNVPSKSDELIDNFINLSKKIGKEKVIWRYDPIILTDKYTIDYHIKYWVLLVFNARSHMANWRGVACISNVGPGRRLGGCSGRGCAGRMGAWVTSRGTRTELGSMPRVGPICMGPTYNLTVNSNPLLYPD